MAGQMLCPITDRPIFRGDNMTQEPLTLYKLIILYMLNRVAFPLTKSQICDFILEHNYTDYLTLQKAFAQLSENDMLRTKTIRNRTQLFVTEEGKSTLSFFENDISAAIREEIDGYLKENNCQLRNEVYTTADYYRTPTGDYETQLIIKERNATLITLKLTVPTEAGASDICEHWASKNQEIYKYITEQLF